MAEIRPISDLRNNFSDISKQVHDEDSVVYLTKNGYGDMVVMSMEHYNKYFAKRELINELTDEELLDIKGAGYKNYEEVKKELCSKLNIK